MLIGLAISAAAPSAMAGEGLALPLPATLPAVSGDGYEGGTLGADGSDTWTHDGAAATVAARSYRLLLDGVPAAPPQAAPDIAVPLGAGGAGYLMQMRVTVAEAPGLWSSWVTIASGTVGALPVLSAAWAGALGQAGYVATVSTDTGAGTLYWDVTQTAAPPADLRTAQSQPVTGPGTQTVTASGLVAGTTYHVHFLQSDGAGHDSAPLSSQSFTTDPADLVPDAFGPQDWSIADAGTGGDATLTIAALPFPGAAAIGGIDWRIGGGAWVALGAASTGVYPLTDAFTDGVPAAVTLRAINIIGPSTASDVKEVTTSTAPASPLTIGSAAYTPGGDGNGPVLEIGDVVLTGTTGPYTVFLATHPNGTTLSKAQIENGTGDALDALNFSDADGAVAGQVLALTESFTNGHLSLFIRDGLGVESAVTRIDGVTVDAAAPVISTLVPSDIAETSAQIAVYSSEPAGAISLRRRPSGNPAWSAAQIIAAPDLSISPVTDTADDTGLSLTPDFWIDAALGNDSNDGSEGSPWASLNKIDGIALGLSQTRTVRVKSGTYDKATDLINALQDAPGATLNLVFEPGCINDGTAYTTANSTGSFFNCQSSKHMNLFGNGMLIRDWTMGTGNGLGGNGGSYDAYDFTVTNCVDGLSCHFATVARYFRCVITDCLKSPVAHINTTVTEHYDCDITEIAGGGTGPLVICNGTSHLFERCRVVPGVAGRQIVLNNSTWRESQIGTLTLPVGGTGASVGAYALIEDSFIHLDDDASKYDLTLRRCFGRLSLRNRNGGAGVLIENCVFSGPSILKSSMFYSNYNPGAGTRITARDNIFETATAAAFMNYDATNAGYVVAAGSVWEHNILSGSAAFDADLIAADTGGTVRVDNVTADALIGAGNTLDPDDYGYGAGSPAIGAASDGGNSGFAIGELQAVGPVGRTLNTGTLTGLTPSTAYALDAVHVDAWGNVSAVLSSSPFTTADAPASSGFTDDFNRANAALTASADWSVIEGPTGVGSIVSNQLRIDLATNFAPKWKAQAAAVLNPAAGIFASVAKAGWTSGGQTWSRYGPALWVNGQNHGYVLENDNGGNRIRLSRQAGPTTTVLAEYTVGQAANGAVLRLERAPNGALVGKLNGTQILTATDTTYTPDRGGLWVDGDQFTIPVFDDFATGAA